MRCSAAIGRQTAPICCCGASTAELGSEDWERREQASEELAEFGYLAQSMMTEALNVTPDPEVRRRIEKILGVME